MSPVVWLMANAMWAPPDGGGGGHFWVFLNWALALRALGCRVYWFEKAGPKRSREELQAEVTLLSRRLRRYDDALDVVLISKKGERPSVEALEDCLDLDEIDDADVVLNMAYRRLPARRRFRRSVFVDIDPGLTQVWMSDDQLDIDVHDLYYTIGETVGQPSALFPDCGINWHYTPPAVHLGAWPVSPAGSDAAYTTVTHWSSETLTWAGKSYENGKREGFLPFIELPRWTSQPLELAVYLRGRGDREDGARLAENGWRIRHPGDVTATPWDYHRYVQHSLGEFSCAKPSCILLQNAWISDRTLCYLASGKPAVVQHTGPSCFLPSAEGLFRFRDRDEAVRALETLAVDYERHCRFARALAEEYFNGCRVVSRILERACS
jgi:hypothetical protein